MSIDATTFNRILRSGWVSFFRNGWVSVASIMVTVLALVMIGSVFFLNVLLTTTLKEVEQKVDFTVRFRVDAEPSAVSSVIDTMKNLPEVKEAREVTPEEELANFRERHQNNALISSSLDEVGRNPFGTTLLISANEPTQYVQISRFLEQNNFDAVETWSSRDNALVVQRLGEIISLTRKGGAALSILLIGIAMLIVFNTIRLTIFTAREEIGVMKLVGASRQYIRYPFLVIGALYGFVASLLTMLMFIPVLYAIGPKTEVFFGNINIFTYFVSNFVWILLMFVSVGVVISVASSFIATRRYLKV